MRHWIRQVLIALDQLANALIGGWADETLSSHAWRMESRRKPWGRLMRPLIDALFFWEREHCLNAYLAELQRAQIHPQMR